MNRIIDVRDAARTLISESGMTPLQLSHAAGRDGTYCYTILRQRSVPRLDTLVRLADACGYQVVLEHIGGERVVLRAGEDGWMRRE